MIHRLTRRMALTSIALAMIPAGLAAQDRVQGAEISPGVVLYATPAGNVVAVYAPDGAFVIGPLSVASTTAIQAELSAVTRSPARYVIATPRDPAQSEGDGGWGRLGAFVATHESSWDRLHDQAARLASLGAERPRAAFSQVLKFALTGHDIHAVHQQPGYSDSDILVHFENAGLVYLGESLPGDGYPVIDTAQGGTVEGLIQTLNPWAGSRRNRFIPARGGVLSGTEVTAFRDMLTIMRDRVRALKRAGRTADQVVASTPSREFDARYGSGRVRPEAFVRTVYQAVSR